MKDDIQQQIKNLQEKEAKKKKKSKKENEELEALKKENEELKSAALRATADLQNFRRRLEDEKKDIASFANTQLILKFLPIVDNFQRSFDHLPPTIADDEWTQGIQHILTQCQQLLEQEGVKEIPVKPGDPIDPNLHEVMLQGEGESGKVVEVLQPGYLLGDKIIRTAKIKAAA